MEDYVEFDEKVDRYLRGQMTEEEGEAFKAELSEDPDKKARAKVIALAAKAIISEEKSSDRRIIDKIEGNYSRHYDYARVASHRTQYNTRVPSRRKHFWSWAAGIAAVIVLFVGIGNFNRASQYKQIGDSYAAAQDLSVFSRGDMTEFKDLQRDFKIIQSDDKDSLKSAVKDLENIYQESRDTSSIFHEYTNYIAMNLAIGYLKNGHNRKAKKVLMELKESQFPAWSESAEEILEKMDKVKLFGRMPE